MKNPEYSFDYNPQLFFARINNSEAWHTLQNKEFRSDYYEAKIMNEYYKTWNSTKEELTNKLHE